MEEKRKRLLDYVFPKPRKESWVLAVLKVLFFLFVLPILVAYALIGIEEGISTWFK